MEWTLILLGCITGIFTGLIPGIHMNTVSVSLIYLMPENRELIYFIAAMAVTHTFIDFIPSIFLGLPEEENFLSILPGHKMLLKGKGLTAIKITVLGGAIGGILSLVFSFAFIELIQKIKWIIPNIIPSVLILALILMVSEEKNKKFSLIVILFSGIIGLTVLNGFFAAKNPLFVLVTGFFALPLLINSILKETKIPLQKKREDKISLEEIKGSLLSVLGGSFISLIPSIGPSISAFIITKFCKLKEKSFLSLLGGINTTNIIFSFFVLTAIGKTRSGSAVAIKELGGITKSELLMLLFTVLIAIIFASIATLFLSKFLVKEIQKFNYKKMNLTALIFLISLIFFFSGINGIIIAFAAALTGLSAIKKRIKKSCCMSFLMFPVLEHYL
jgi:putative membrane protein